MTPPDLARFRETAAERLRAHRPTSVPDTPGLRRAAVVLCVMPDATGEPVVVLIKRAHRGRNPGQWALPGGRLEPGETSYQAALRELHEELGVSVHPTDILGRLDDFPAASGFAITPIVATSLTPHPLTLSPDEVHSAHEVPLRILADPAVPHWAPQPDGPPLLQMRITPQILIHAPTGAILWQFREIVLLGTPSDSARIADTRQPGWTRR